MKCSKCGYLGFDSVDRCRNCGYEFSLAPTFALPDLPIRQDRGRRRRPRRSGVDRRGNGTARVVRFRR